VGNRARLSGVDRLRRTGHVLNLRSGLYLVSLPTRRDSSELLLGSF
jgi:hypothetical protein